MKPRVLGASIVVLLAAYAIVHAGTTGKITGVVKDAQTGEELVGASVLIEGTTMGAATDIEGYYVILNVPPGNYNVVASAVGYSRKTITGVSVSVDLTTTLNIDLAPTVIEGEEVIVTAERRVLRKDLTSSESRVDASAIEKLPVSEVAEVLSLQAGVTQGSDGAIHIRGGRTSEVAYWVDGVSVSDVYDGGQAVQVDNRAVQELQVISGTFNAEYGQAMSGIINIVTKDGGQKLSGSLSAYTGDYVTSDGWTYDNRLIRVDGTVAPDFTPRRLFYNLNDVNPFDNYNIEGGLSGPIPGVDDISFYVSGRYFRSNGYLYGNKIFNPDGSLAPDTTGAFIFEDDRVVAIYLPDNPVSMNSRTRLSGQAKLTFQVSGSAKLSLSALGSKIDYRDYGHDWFLAPDGDVRKFDRGFSGSALWTHTLGSSAFYTVNFSFFGKEFREHLYDSQFDSSYIVDPNFANNQNYEFKAGGTNLHRFERRTKTFVGKIDYTDQLNRLHQLKAGIEGKLHRLYLQDYNVSPDQFGNFVPTIPPITSPLYEEYTERPVELSAYVQDKLEYEQMVVNIGVRFDYFNSRGKTLNDDPTAGLYTIDDPNVYDPLKPEHQALALEERLAKWYKKADPKYAVSPRFGISYPITDRGILHFSYGHFLQIPSFIHLYQKPGFKVPSSETVQGVYGNANLDPQKTVMYEFGLQQELTSSLGFDVTGFYRDTRDWVTTSPEIRTVSTRRYVIYINRDYANSRGVTVSVNKRPSADLLTFNLSYTFQTAEGINSNPDDERAAIENNSEPSRSLTPLDWDQTHTANVTLGVGENDWGVFVLGRYGSGLPYTPAVRQAESQGQDAARTVQNNSRRRPTTYSVDLRMFKNITLEPLTFSFFIKVFNVFDRRNEVTVYGETGRATATLEALGIAGLNDPNRLNPPAAYIIRPDYYSEPREIQVGVEVNF